MSKESVSRALIQPLFRVEATHYPFFTRSFFVLMETFSGRFKLPEFSMAVCME